MTIKYDEFTRQKKKGRRKLPKQQPIKGEVINRISYTERYTPISIKVASEKNDA